MRFKLRTHDDYMKWHKWFSWHPVVVQDEWVWLEHIERKWFCGCEYDWYEYRFIKND